MLEKELHFRQTSLIQSVVFPLSYAPALWLALHGGGVWSLIAQSVTYNALSLVVVWWTVRRIMPWLWQSRWRFDPISPDGLRGSAESWRSVCWPACC